MTDTFGPGIIGGVVLVDPATGIPYRATGSGETGGSVDWDTGIANKPAVIAAGADAAAARTAIGAGTSDLAIGTSGTTAAAGNDARLSDARTPTTHAHAGTDITSGTVPIARIPTGTTSSTVPFGNDARFSDARTPTAHVHSGADITSGTVPIAQIPTGTTGTTVPFGNDARFSDSRTPTAHNHAASEVTSGAFTNARLPVKFPVDEWQASNGTWPSTDAEATRRVNWIGYPGLSTPPAASGRPASVTGLDSYTLRT